MAHWANLVTPLSWVEKTIEYQAKGLQLPMLPAFQLDAGVRRFKFDIFYTGIFLCRYVSTLRCT
jgi:hypothetical protein